MLAALLLLLPTLAPPETAQEPGRAAAAAEQAAQQDPFPGAAPEALAYLAARMAPYLASDSLRIKLTGTMRADGSYGSMRLEGHATRPRGGNLEYVRRTVMRLEGDDVGKKTRKRFLGGDEGIDVLDLENDLPDGHAEDWAGAGFAPGHPLLEAWAAGEPSTMHDLSFVADPEDGPDAVGLQWLDAHGLLHAMWFDEDGNWTTTTVEEDLGEGRTREYRYFVEVLVLDAAAPEPAAADPAYPGADLAALAFLKKSLAAVRDAQALHFRLSGTQHAGDDDFGATVIEGRIAKPAAGRVDIEVREVHTRPSGEHDETTRRMSLRGNGRGVWMADDDEQTVQFPPATGWSTTEGLMDLPHMAAWAGAPPPEMQDLAFAPPDEENYPGHRGLTWTVQDEIRITAWFTPDGAWVALHVLSEAGTEFESRTWLAVESLQALSEVDVADYAAPLPDGYEVVQESTVERVTVAAPEEAAAADAEGPLYPHADADALAWWLAWRGKAAAAQGLDFDAALTLESPQASGTMSFRVHAAKAALGRIEAESRMTLTLEDEDARVVEERRLYVGDGTVIRRTLPEGPEVETWSRWGDCEIADGLFALAAWSGAQQVALHGLRFVEAPPERAGQTGITWQSDDRLQQTWWFDADGRWLGGTIEDGSDPAAPRFTLVVEGFALHAEVDGTKYRGEVPEDPAAAAQDAAD